MRWPSKLLDGRSCNWPLGHLDHSGEQYPQNAGLRADGAFLCASGMCGTGRYHCQKVLTYRW
jgi:hypothetical protein